MNFTKKSISIVLFLAFVFTTIVCVSVGASLDFPIHESVVTYNSVNGQNTAKADVIGGGKIAFFNSEKVNQIGSMVTANSSNVKSLVNSAIGSGATIKVDIYAEFTAQSGATTVPARFMFGDEWVEPKTAVSFTHGTLVTAEFKSSDFSVNDLTNSSTVSVKMVPDEDDSVTGSFYASVPYLSGAAQASTVPVTSFRTTTTKATTEYTGKIDIHDTPVTISGKNTGYGNPADVVIGDNNYSTNAKFVFFKNSEPIGQQQLQADLLFTGFDTLYEQAKQENKDICFDVYSNAFADNGGATYAYMMHKLGSYQRMNYSDQNIIVRPKQVKTFVVPINELTASTNKLFIQFQQYTWGQGKIKDLSLIITAPYLEGADIVTTDYEPQTTTKFTVADEDFTGNVICHNSGVKYTGTATANGRGNFGVGGVGDYEKTFAYIQYDGKIQQMQMQGIKMTGLAELKSRAVSSGKKILIDVYANAFKNGTYTNAKCDMKIYGGIVLGSDSDKRVIYASKKRVFEIDPNNMSGSDSVNWVFQNYSYNDYATIVDGTFIVSVPYVEGDPQTEPVDPSTTIKTTTTTTLASINYHDTEEDHDIAMKMHSGDVYFKSLNWSKPTTNGQIKDANGKTKIVYVTSEDTNVENGQWQISTSTSTTDNKSDFGQMILQAAKENKKICVDFYGNFKSVGKNTDVMHARMNFGLGKWFGNKEDATIGDEVKDWIKLTPDVVTTGKYDAKKLLEIAGTVFSSSKNYEAESATSDSTTIVITSDVAPTTVSTNDTFTGEPKGAQYANFAGLALGDTITYTAKSLNKGSYQLNLKTRDYKGAKFDVYVDGVKQATSLDCTSSGKSYQQHYIANTSNPIVLSAAKNVEVKLVCTKVAEGSSSLTLDKISFEAIESEEERNATLAEKFNQIATQMAYDTKNDDGSGWPWPKVNYGRVYMSAPYIEGAEESDISVPTTTTTKSIPSTTNPVSMPAGGWDMDKIDLSYIDGRISSSWWNGSPSGKVKVEVSGNRKYEKIEQVSSDYIKQIQDCFYINGGKSSIAFQEYVDYAKQADAWIAIDIFPQFETGDNNSPYCYFKSSGWKWPKSDYDFKLTSGKKFTFMIDPNDIPENTDNFEADFLNYSSFGSGFKNAMFYVTAPYLFDVKNPDSTTTTTEKPTTEKITTITYPYPENNQNGSTRFKVLDTQVGIFGEVKVPVAISGNEGLSYANFTLKYNKNDLTFNGVDTTGCSVFDNVYASSKADANKLGEVNITLEQNAGDTFKNGTIFYLSFEADANENADLISFAGGDGYVASNFFNSNGQNVPCSFTNGYVSIGDATTRITSPDPNDVLPYPTTNSGTTKFDISTVSDTYAANKADKEYTVYVSVSGNAGLKGAKFSVKYDDNLQFIGSSVAEDSTVFNRLESVGYNFTPTEKTPGILEYNIYPTNSNVKDSTNNGKIVSITFKLKNYVVGTYPVEFGGLSYDPANFKNVAGASVPCAFQSGAIKITGAKLATPKVSVKLTKKNVAKVSWKKVANAVSYEVYQSIGSSKSFKKVATTKSTSRTVKKLKLAKKYNFKVKAIGNDATSAFSAVKSITPLNHKTKVVIKSVKSSKKATVKVTLKKKVAGATGYQIRYANNSKFKGAKKATTKTLTKTIKKLASKTYYFKARTFNKVNGKTKYGKWSKVKKVKVK